MLPEAEAPATAVVMVYQYEIVQRGNANVLLE